MASLSKSAIEIKYNDPSTGLFKDNITQSRVPGNERQFVEDYLDSTFNLNDNAYNGAKGVAPSATSITDLKAIATVSLSYGVHFLFRDSGNFDALRVYELTNSTTAESSPEFIRPDDYNGTTNTKVWRLVKLFPKVSLPGITTITGLKAVLTAGVAGLPVGSYISFADSSASDILRTYKLTSGTTAESSPSIIRPDDYAASTNEKIWVQVAESSVGTTSKWRGGYDASTNLYPSGGGSGTAGAIIAGDTWHFTVGGTLAGDAWPVKTIAIALTDTPGTTDANWRLI